jgi:AcrR family transcriptional regulator
MTVTRDATREKILVAAETVFADNGYHDALVDEIGRRTAVSKGGIYFHFPSKEDLFFAVLDRLADRLVSKAESVSTLTDSPLERAQAALESVLVSLAKRRRLARLLMVQGYSMGNAFERKRVQIFDRFAEVIRRQLDAALAQGEIRPLDTALAARVWLGAVNEIIIHWLYAGGPSPIDSLPEIRRMLLGAVAPACESSEATP